MLINNSHAESHRLILFSQKLCIGSGSEYVSTIYMYIYLGCHLAKPTKLTVYLTKVGLGYENISWIKKKKHLQ